MIGSLNATKTVQPDSSSQCNSHCASSTKLKLRSRTVRYMLSTGRNYTTEITMHTDDQEIAANGRQPARRRMREERWRRVRSLRLKSWCFSVLLPFAVFIAFCLCEVGAYYLVQLMPGLNRHDATVYGFAAQVAVAILFIAAGVYVIFSVRTNAWIQRLGRRVPWVPSTQPMPKAKFHARYCAARNRGTAAIFLGFSAMEVAYAWHDVSKPLPGEQYSIFLVVGLLCCIAFLVDLSLTLTCFRERLVLIIGAADFALMLVVRAAPATAAEHASAFREIPLLLWAASALVSLALLKSALQSPPPGT